MPTEKQLNTRITQKIDTTVNWEKATNFKPKKGEIIVYQDSTFTGIKVGDGVTTVINLPFVFNSKLKTSNFNYATEEGIDERFPFGLEITGTEVYIPEQTVTATASTLDFGDGQTYSVFEVANFESTGTMIDAIKGNVNYLLNKYYRATIDGTAYYLFNYIHTRVLTTGLQNYESDPSAITANTNIGLSSWDDAYLLGDSSIIGIDNSNNEEGVPFLLGTARWGSNNTDAKSLKLFFTTSGSHTIKLERLVVNEKPISTPILAHADGQAHPLAQKKDGGINLGMEIGSNNNLTSLVLNNGVVKVDNSNYGRNVNIGSYVCGQGGYDISLGSYNFVKDSLHSSLYGYSNKAINARYAYVAGVSNLVKGYSYEAFARPTLIGTANSYKAVRDTSRMLPSVMIGAQNSDVLGQNIQIGYQNSIGNSGGCFNFGLSNTIPDGANLAINIGFGNTGTARTMRLGYYTDSSNTTDRYQFGDGTSSAGHNMFAFGNDGTNYRFTLNNTTITEPELIALKEFLQAIPQVKRYI